MHIENGPAHGASQFRRLLRQDVYEALLDEFLVGHFVPGERIRDEEIATRLGVSRTPIREALTRLTAAGLVDTSPNRYTRVSELFTPEAAEAALVLEVLYAQALPRVLDASTDSDMLELELLARRIEMADDPDPYDALEGLRFFCADRLGSSVLLQAIRGVQPRVLRVMRQCPDVLADAGGIALVSRLIAALLARDLDAAQRTISALIHSIHSSIEDRAGTPATHRASRS